MKKAFLSLAVAAVVAGLFLVGLWYLGIPDQYVADKIGQLNIQPLDLEINGFRKGLFFTFSADSLVLRNRGEEIWKITDVRGKINPLRFFFARAELRIRGASYGGDLSGTLNFGKNNAAAELAFGGIEISRIASLEALGLKASGILAGNVVYDGKGGRVEAVLNNAELAGFSTGGMFVPLKYFHTARGAAEIVPPAMIAIKSFSLEGRGIYARIKGEITGGRADLGIEIMPEPAFEDNSLFLLLDRYKVSEGYYFIPIRSQL